MSDHDEQPTPPYPSWTHAPGPEGDATIEDNWLFQLRRERFQSRLSNQAHSFYVLHLADAVYALALTADDEMIFVRQFRAGSRRDSLEPPGGLVDAGEDPCAAAARELLEETGFAGDPPVLIGSAYSNPSIMTSRIHVTVIRNARRVAAPKLDHAEEVAVEFIPARDVRGMIDAGSFDHALSVLALLWWLAGEPALNREGARSVPGPCFVEHRERLATGRFGGGIATEHRGDLVNAVGVAQRRDRGARAAFLDVLPDHPLSMSIAGHLR